MLSELPITIDIAIAAEFETTTQCHVCESDMVKQNHCDFCGKSTCELCIVKRRKYNDQVWHPICEFCEMIFVESLLISSCKSERELLTKQLEQANSDLVNKRSQLYQLKNFALHSDGTQKSEQQLQKLDDNIRATQQKKENQLFQLQAIEAKKIELKQSSIQLTQNLETKQIKLQETQNKVKKEKDELEEIQRQIDEFMANLPLLEAEQKSALTQLDISNLEQIFRGSNLSDVVTQQIKQSQVQQQNSKAKKSGTNQQNKECAIF